MATKGKTYNSHAVGRRKSSVARVYVSENGNGGIKINKRDIKDYFPKGTNRYVVNQPLNLLKLADKYDINVNVKGGGTTGQAGAIRLGVARALIKLDPTLRVELKKAGFLTRDSRKVERKKPGLAGARKKFQFSKR
ncbi:30S ribosomal protein S9 [Bacteriovoracaceae bacterium]|nr:30S ribosomal protein S9 [Bacteriovoracaceae bacterium]|tara:strand:+ start:255574 stop:255981 length:408 start_codon:yes stop_codon:yes gene_type:complete